MNFTKELGIRSKRTKISMKVRYLASAVHVSFLSGVLALSLYRILFGSNHLYGDS